MPCADGTTPYRKDPIEQAASLQLATWDIFEAMWNARTTILHGEDSKLWEKIRQQKIACILEFKNSKELMLHRSDHFIVGFHVGDVIKLTSRKRRRMVEILERLHKVHLAELKIEREGLQGITLFFQPSQPAAAAPVPSGAGCSLRGNENIPPARDLSWPSNLSSHCNMYILYSH